MDGQIPAWAQEPMCYILHREARARVEQGELCGDMDLDIQTDDAGRVIVKVASGRTYRLTPQAPERSSSTIH